MTLATTAILGPPATEPDDLAEPTVPQEWPYRMSLEVYERLCERSIIPREDHVTLLDGILMRSGPKTPPSCTACNRGSDVLRAMVPAGWIVQPGRPIVLRDGPFGDSVPEPELTVLIGPNRERYGRRHPRPADVGLIGLIVETPQAFAFERDGLFRYAHGGVPLVWIIALFERQIHVFSEPTGPTAAPGYTRAEVKRSDEQIEALLPALELNQSPTTLGPLLVASFFRDPR